MYNKLLINNIDNFEKKIEDYARLLLVYGVKFKKGRALAIECSTVCPELARACSKVAYSMGAKDVMVNWVDPYVVRDKYANSDISNLGNEFDWPQAARDKYGDDLAFLLIESYNTDFFNCLDAERIGLYNKGVQNIFASLKLGLKIPYVICVSAGKEWANKVYPDLTDDEAYIKLWNTLFDLLYVDGVNDPIKIWEEKSNKCFNYQKILNEYHFEKLHVTSGLGTDVMVELPKNHQWMAPPINFTAGGQHFCANMPTEEMFTIPSKLGVNGKVVASRPMICKAGPVYDVKLEIKDGKIVNYEAGQGKETLDSIINSDPNGRYLGEMAIVSSDTAIFKSGISYFNNMIDENSGCHMAVGNAYSKCIVGGLQMSNEELEAEGINICSFHEDFVFGTADTKIVGYTKDGKEVVILDNGVFTI